MGGLAGSADNALVGFDARAAVCHRAVSGRPPPAIVGSASVRRVPGGGRLARMAVRPARFGPRLREQSQPIPYRNGMAPPPERSTRRTQRMRSRRRKSQTTKVAKAHKEKLRAGGARSLLRVQRVESPFSASSAEPPRTLR